MNDIFTIGCILLSCFWILFPSVENPTTTMKLLLILYLKTKSMKQIDWKGIMLYIIRIIEMLLTGAAGGALVNNL